MVFIGLLVEVWGAVEYRPAGVSITQTWEPAVSGALIAIGVFFEILFGRWALQQGAELRQRAELALAEATEKASGAIGRAAEAEKEAASTRLELAYLQRQLAPRRLSTDQFEAIINVMLGHKMSLALMHMTGDSESAIFANDISRALSIAGSDVSGISAVMPEPIFVIAIQSRRGDSGAADRLELALKSAGIVSVRWEPSDRLMLVVGNKPPAIA